jgi:hypothetical protein
VLILFAVSCGLIGRLGSDSFLGGVIPSVSLQLFSQVLQTQCRSHLGSWLGLIPFSGHEVGADLNPAFEPRLVDFTEALFTSLSTASQVAN